MSLQDRLDRMTIEGELYEVVDAATRKIRCYACGHRCLIKEGGRGVCKVRYNQEGKLRVPYGYVGTIQVDPIEKKPFNHVDPGAGVLSFGMLGCDFHCGYCFSPETMIITEDGANPICELYERFPEVGLRIGESVSFPDNLRVVTGSGLLRQVTKIFKHSYHGKFSRIKPYYLPEILCTPDHRIYATLDPDQPLQKIPASELTKRHFLAVPRKMDIHEKEYQVLDLHEILAPLAPTFRTPHRLTSEAEFILQASEQGVSSREIGAQINKSPNHVRHIRSIIHRGDWTDLKQAELIEEDGLVRFSKDHQPGIPEKIRFDEQAARLFGLYCAEGSIVDALDRPNGTTLNFSFGRHERILVEATAQLLYRVFGIESQIVVRETTLTVSTGKSTVIRLFKTLFGVGATEKKVANVLFHSPPSVIRAFIDSYVQGAGHRTDHGKVSITTKSRTFAYNVAWLLFRIGYLPSVYVNEVGTERLIQGRLVQQSPLQYTVAWYEHDSPIQQKYLTTATHYLIRVRDIEVIEYSGDVYNMEVEAEHNYLANFALVSNCQNWEISQHGRDEDAGRDPTPITPEEIITLARRHGASAIASTYNEPLITTEWAVGVFKLAKEAGLRTLYISNGNGTPEVIKYLRPHLDAYKIDLKTMQDSQYRRLGGVLQHVLDTIQMTHAAGLQVEVVTLVIPGFNDSPEELWDAARFIASVSPDIPWHVTAFHPDYKMMDTPATSVKILSQAAEIGQEAGLHYVYAGNLPGRVGAFEHTFCPGCGEAVVKRHGFRVLENRLKATGGICPRCGTRIPGIWG